MYWSGDRSVDLLTKMLWPDTPRNLGAMVPPWQNTTTTNNESWLCSYKEFATWKNSTSHLSWKWQDHNPVTTATPTHQEEKDQKHHRWNGVGVKSDAVSCTAAFPKFSKINSRKDSASWMDLATPTLPGIVLIRTSLLQGVPFSERRARPEQQARVEVNNDPTLEPRLKMQMRRPGDTNLNPWREEGKSCKSNKDRGGVREPSVSISALPPNVQWLWTTQLSLEILSCGKKENQCGACYWMAD